MAQMKSSAVREIPPKKLKISPLEYLHDNFDALVDFILVVPIEKPLSEEVNLEQSDHYKEKPTWGIVAAVGTGRVVNGVLIPIDVEFGDEVYFTKYGEDVELDGRKAQLIHASEVKIRRKQRTALL
jgi:chaperonin GroES